MQRHPDVPTWATLHQFDCCPSVAPKDNGITHQNDHGVMEATEVIMDTFQVGRGLHIRDIYVKILFTFCLLIHLLKCHRSEVALNLVHVC